MKLATVIFMLGVTFVGSQPARPNIVWIFADDLGFNDMGLKNPEIITPNMDWLATNGMIFRNSYTQAVCTPSRHSFMTGRYPYKSAQQNSVIMDPFPECSGFKYKFLPEHLKELGYATHAVGKWHLGYCRVECTPTYRGFDSHFGFYSGANTYYTHLTYGGNYDFHNNTRMHNPAMCKHSEVLYVEELTRILDNVGKDKPFFIYMAFQNPHSPLDPQPQYRAMYEDKDWPEWRKNYVGLVTGMDEVIGHIRKKLEENDHMENTYIVFSSDNGGDVHEGDNSPLRGGKGSLFEGGTKPIQFIYSPLIDKTRDYVDGLMHITDWHPTIIRMAGGTPPTAAKDGIDGMDMYDMIFKGAPSPRKKMVYNIDREYGRRPQHYGEIAVRNLRYKLIWGVQGQTDGYGLNLSYIFDQDFYKNFNKPHSHRQKRGGPYLFEDDEWAIYHRFAEMVRVTDQNLNAGIGRMQLYDLQEDPYETTDLAKSGNPIHQHNLWELIAMVQEEVRNNYVGPTPATNIFDHNYNLGNIAFPGWCRNTLPFP